MVRAMPVTKRHQQTPRKSKVAKTAPERTCIGCRTRRPTADLVRFGSADGHLKIGQTVSGRGAWLCAETVDQCFETARKRNAVVRDLRQDVTDAQLDQLAEALSDTKDSG